jgi:hypothetical protein
MGKGQNFEVISDNSNVDRICIYAISSTTTTSATTTTTSTIIIIIIHLIYSQILRKINLID